MSVVIHIRIPRRLKEKLDELGVNISEEVRSYLERRVRQLEMQKLARELKEELGRERKAADSTPLIRYDREHH
jgi:predicted DNA-binding protein